MSRTAPAIPLLLLLCLPAGWGCGRRPPQPNVVLITLDTVRADHLSLYGYPVRTSPRLEAFARGATVYERAQAAAPWTVPTHASLFTGRFPFEHGAHTVETTEPGENVHPLDASQVTLAEVLRDRGWQTAAFCANDAFLAPRWGMNQGFETYEVERVPAGPLNRRVLAWLDEKRRPDRPFFLFVNYMDAHQPYNSAPRPGLIPREVGQDSGRLLRELYNKVMPGQEPAPPELVQRIEDQYDTAIANLDESVGELLDQLSGRQLLDEAVIVITSDHGEYFGEHSLVEHSKDVYQQALWVPLVVKDPRQRRGRRESRVASSVDVPRLILDQLPDDPGTKTTFPYRLGNHLVLSENYYARTKDLFGHPWARRFRRVRTALLDWPYKYIRSTDGRDELYEVEHDPAESVNLLGARPKLADRLSGALAGFEAGRKRAGGDSTVTPATAEELQALRSLGYVGDS